jgi:hypothetical protein
MKLSFDESLTRIKQVTDFKPSGKKCPTCNQDTFYSVTGLVRHGEYCVVCFWWIDYEPVKQPFDYTRSKK